MSVVASVSSKRVRGLRRISRRVVAERGSFGTCRGETEMAIAVQKITLSPSRDIPFSKLRLSQANVRQVQAGVSIDDLAEDIARRGLLPYKADHSTLTYSYPPLRRTRSCIYNVNILTIK